MSENTDETIQSTIHETVLMQLPKNIQKYFKVLIL